MVVLYSEKNVPIIAAQAAARIAAAAMRSRDHVPAACGCGGCDGCCPDPGGCGTGGAPHPGGCAAPYGGPPGRLGGGVAGCGPGGGPGGPGGGPGGPGGGGGGPGGGAAAPGPGGPADGTPSCGPPCGASGCCGSSADITISPCLNTICLNAIESAPAGSGGLVALRRPAAGRHAHRAGERPLRTALRSPVPSGGGDTAERCVRFCSASPRRAGP